MRNSSYSPISLLDTAGKLFEKILPARAPWEVSERGFLREEQFGFGSRQQLQLARHAESQEVSINGTAFLDVAKAFETMANYPKRVKTIYSYLDC